MNPVGLIRPWLEACSVQRGIGAEGYFEIECPDPSTHAPEIYFEYSLEELDEESSAPSVVNTSAAEESYDVIVHGAQEWIAMVKVTLHNSQNGMAELAGVCIAAQKDPEILSLFQKWGAGYVKGSGKVRSQSKRMVSEPSISSQSGNTEDGVGIRYKHVMTCILTSSESFTHKKINHRVGAIDESGAFTLYEGE